MSERRENRERLRKNRLFRRSRSRSKSFPYKEILMLMEQNNMKNPIVQKNGIWKEIYVLGARKSHIYARIGKIRSLVPLEVEP